MSFLTKLVIILLVITKLCVIWSHPTALEQKVSLSSSSSSLSSLQHKNNLTQDMNIGTIIGHCLVEPEITRCFKKRMIEKLDNAIEDDETWQLNDYVVIEKDPDWKSKRINLTDYNDLNDILTKKFEDFAESRSIRLTMKSKNEEQGRKKKDKGGFALMGGIAIAGMMAQLFMGKIVMIAGVALVLSKIALLFSVLNALKKGTGSSEHVVYSGGSGSSHEGSWHRSVPRYNDEQYDNNRYPDDSRLK